MNQERKTQAGPRAVAALILLAISGNIEAATVGQWRGDIDHVVADIRLHHPAPFVKCGELTFLRKIAALEESLPALTEEERVVGLMRVVALVGDGHTQVEPHRDDFGYWYPIRLYQFTDGVFITSAHRSLSELAGAQVLEIAGQPVDTVLARARELMGCDNSFDCLERLYAVHSPSLMRGLGFAGADGTLKIRVRLTDGTISDRTLPRHVADNPRYDARDSTFEWQFRREMFGPPAGADSEWVSAFRGVTAEGFRTADSGRPPHMIRPHVFTMQAIPERDAIYIQEGQSSDAMVAEFEKALRAVDAQKPRRLIVDLRFNFGGDGSRVAEIAHLFIRREAAPPWRELYILSGRKTFSAGVMTLAALIANVPATVVGEPAGAALNSSGDPTERIYPATGLSLHVSTVRHQLGSSSDIREFIRVDVPAQFSFAEWVSGKDPAVDAILSGEEVRAIPAIALSDGGAAAARAYEERKRRFGSDGWWTPPTELELRHACQQLLEQKRIGDAVRTCSLSTEIHPFIWNSWYNLAHAQVAAGLLPESLASYRRVLEVDPANINRDEIREAVARGLRPAAAVPGATVVATRTALAGQCTSIRTRRIDPPFLSGVKHEQLQIDCDGFPFLGARRHAEFVFRDDALVMTWILTREQEANALEERFRSVYGDATSRNPKYIAFGVARAAIRLDRPEVLFYSEASDPDVVPDLR